MSTRPYLATTLAKRSAVAWRLVRSAGWTLTRSVSSGIVFNASDSRSALLEFIATRAPSWASRMATARPIPLLDAVTSATFPFSLRSIDRFLAGS